MLCKEFLKLFVRLILIRQCFSYIISFFWRFHVCFSASSWTSNTLLYLIGQRRLSPDRTCIRFYLVTHTPLLLLFIVYLIIITTTIAHLLRDNLFRLLLLFQSVFQFSSNCWKTRMSKIVGEKKTIDEFLKKCVCVCFYFFFFFQSSNAFAIVKCMKYADLEEMWSLDKNFGEKSYFNCQSYVCVRKNYYLTVDFDH